VAAQILRFVDPHQPGWVEAELVDAKGTSHRLLDKVAIFTDRKLDAASPYPQVGIIRCEIVSETKDGTGHDLIEIALLDGVESIRGQSRFVITSEQLAESSAC
jgi:hypothetical protein